MTFNIDYKILFIVIVTIILVVGSFLLSYWVVNRDLLKTVNQSISSQFLNKNQKLSFKRCQECHLD